MHLGVSCSVVCCCLVSPVSTTYWFFDQQTSPPLPPPPLLPQTWSVRIVVMHWTGLYRIKHSQYSTVRVQCMHILIHHNFTYFVLIIQVRVDNKRDLTNISL